MPTAEQLKDRVDALRESRAYRNYEMVRERVLEMKALEESRRTGIFAPSDYWEEELANFEYMWDASPFIIEKLRHHTFHITGLRVYDYRSNKDKVEAQVARKLAALRQVGGDELLVPEARELGGFGFQIDGGLYNVDTLKFYESLIALQKGAVLPELQEPGERRVVWEIGAGWGGFAYQLKTLCPNATYVITDFPELFLFSATYLLTMFPEAQAAFYGIDDAGSWLDADFVFVPNTFLDELRPARCDLTVNTVSFQEMTTEQVRAYVQHAYDLGCQYLYSLNRDRSYYNPELGNVRELIAERYWPHEIEVLPVSYVNLKDDPTRPRPQNLLKKVKGGKEDLDYKHVIGWRRVS